MKKLWIVVIFIISLFTSKSYAGCSKNDHFLGAPSGKKMMSTFDVTFFPIFTFSSTSGTSGCKNWDLVQVEQVRTQWLIGTWDQMLEDLARGQTTHITAFSNLLDCPSQVEYIRASLIRNYHVWSQEPTPYHFEEAQQLLQKIHDSLIKNPKIKETCYLNAS